MEHPSKTSIVKAAGLVFGDIGTSPIYTLAVLFLFLTPTPENVMGAVSLVFWTLVIMVTVQYTFLAMRLSETGEGGTLVLKGLLLPLLKKPKGIAAFTLLATLGISLMIGECVITPAISILSAVEGIRQIPGLEIMSQEWLIFLAILITLGLFLFQKRGTEGVSRTFGPVMVVWFLVLFTSGAISVSLSPEILFAINPLYAVQFFVHNGIQGFVSLSMIVLCATGAEALFADMGHLGREPIQYAWGFVFVAVLFSYMGQAAYLLRNPGVGNPLFEMVFSISHDIYIPFLILMIIATVIASQSVISGIFSIIYQAITTHLLPMLPVDYTSDELRTQIYINTINWLLCVAVICVLLIFQFSDRLASAYGLSVTATMSITGSFMVAIFFHRQKYIYMGIAIVVTMVDILFFLTTVTKIPHGGYLSLVIASIPFTIIIIFTAGQRALYRSMKPLGHDQFIKKYLRAYKYDRHIRGTALFFARSLDEVPAYISRTMFNNEIIYDENIIISLDIKKEPYGFSWQLDRSIEPGLSRLSISHGYMQIIDLMKIIRDAGIEEKTIFYGMEEIVTRNIVWKIFSAIKRLCPSFVQYHRLPSHKVHGVITRVEL
ncbi:KUP/HAK/KT family potassium transporter [Methanospirillum sp.]|jgi:KUP system potassium uptake protein|uniref:KUP/HAK/KT family potassium transporter n=3 Tax=Methanospirillum sp. TaxID=45200 RepID=UPI001BD646DD|nr:KUP/HAK/KT family potassium transporter [Methanospirillum sp.]